MNRALGAVLLLLLLWMGVAYFRPAPPAEPPPEPSPSPAAAPGFKPAPAPPRPSAPSRFRAAPAPRATQGLAPPKPEGNVIAFEIVDGFAVAYGDVLVGKPEEGAQMKTGYFEAPTPQTWPRREIPYGISPELPNPSRVERALNYFREKTPVNFVPYTGQRDAVIFEPGTSHCFSSLGMMGGLQPVRLSKECQAPEIIHEIMHVLGFVHEQSRPDRDQYVEVLWENIEEQYRPQYNVVPDTFLGPLRGTPFDFRSAMLYRPDSFLLKSAPAGSVTLRPRPGAQAINPVSEGLSEGDLERLRQLYP